MRGLSEWTGYFRIAPKKTKKSQKLQLSLYGGLRERSKDIKMIRTNTIVELCWPLGDPKVAPKNNRNNNEMPIAEAYWGLGAPKISPNT